MAMREQGLVFGEVAEQYDEARPSYPEELFDALVEYAALQPGDPVLEIGAGTGKATMPMVARGFAVTAVEPVPEMAAVLRKKGVDAVVTKFGEYDGRGFRLAYAAQSWHWVRNDDRYSRVARAADAVAVFWNVGREWTGALGSENDAVYEQYAPHLVHAVRDWNTDGVLDELRAHGAFRDVEKRTFTWTHTYTTAEWLRLLGTHSDHRMLPDDVREPLHAAVGEVIDRHGGRVDMVIDAQCYFARRS